jgi:hypothetical protein
MGSNMAEAHPVGFRWPMKARERGALVASEVLKRVPAPRAMRKPLRLLASALGLASGLAMRQSMVIGGRAAAADPHLSRLAGRPRVAPA